MHLCPADGAVQAAVRADPSNALSIIEEANNKECPYNWHVKRHQTQYVPIEVERKVAVKEYVDRPVSHPVPDPEVERQLQRTREELDALRATIPGLQKEQDGSLKDRLNLKVCSDCNNLIVVTTSNTTNSNRLLTKNSAKRFERKTST